MDSLDFFATPGRMTDPGRHGALLDGLPSDIRSLCRVAQGLMIHVFWAERYGITVPPERMGELQQRGLGQKLARILELDPRPLTEARPPERRLIGNCRDFSLLLAGMLQHQGVPARARCGFGAYFEPGKFVDHWVAEYWDAGRQTWVLTDAQLDGLQVGVLKPSFDPVDVPRDQFVVGGRAWRMCRAGQADPDAFGIMDMKGLWFVRGDFVRDVVALNKVELLPWDAWGLGDRADAELSADDLAALDHMAELTAGDVPGFAQVRSLYDAGARWRVPSVINSYTGASPERVELGSAVPMAG